MKGGHPSSNLKSRLSSSRHRIRRGKQDLSRNSHFARSTKKNRQPIPAGKQKLNTRGSRPTVKKKKSRFVKARFWNVQFIAPYVPPHTHFDTIIRRTFYRKLRHLIIKGGFFSSWKKRLQLFRFVMDYRGSFVVRDEPVEVSDRSTDFYEHGLRNLSSFFPNLPCLGRGAAFYYPDLVNLKTQAWKSEIVITTYLSWKSRRPYVRRRPLLGYAPLLNNFSRAYKKTFRSTRLKFWDWVAGLPTAALGSLGTVQMLKHSTKSHLGHNTYANLSRFLSVSFFTLLSAQALLVTVAIAFRSCWLKVFFRQRFGWKKGPGRTIKTTAYEVLKKNINRALLWFFKIESATSIARQTFMAEFTNIWAEKLLGLRKVIADVALSNFNWNFDFDLFLEQYAKHLLVLERIENRRLFSNYHSTGSVMGFRFLARLNHLLTKRGNAFKAFKTILTLRTLIKRQTSPMTDSAVKLHKFVSDPWLAIMWNLRTYFYQRKFTQGRKTIFIPGILRARKRLRVAARWFAVVARRKKLGVRLLDVLVENARAVYSGSGPSIALQKDFNNSVRGNKINIQPKRGARRFKINPEGPLRKKNVVVKPRPRPILRPNPFPHGVPRDLTANFNKGNETVKFTKKKARYQRTSF